MGNKKKKNLLILFIVFALAACSQNIENELIGSWECVTLKQNIQFAHGGLVELNDSKHGVYKGEYEITDGNTLKCDFDRFAYPVVRTVRIRGEQLILADNNGRQEIYIRQL